MLPPDIKLSEVSERPDAADVSSRLEENLLEALAETNPQFSNANIVLALETSAGELVGGLCGRTSYGWLLIKILWIHNDYRNLNLGRLLVGQAEFRAESYDCHSVWLDTSSVQAMKFYQSCGFEIFAELSNHPGQIPSDHTRWFMKKLISNNQ